MICDCVSSGAKVCAAVTPLTSHWISFLQRQQCLELSGSLTFYVQPSKRSEVTISIRSHGRPDNITSKFRKWPLFMRLKKSQQADMTDLEWCAHSILKSNSKLAFRLLTLRRRLMRIWEGRGLLWDSCYQMHLRSSRWVFDALEISSTSASDFSEDTWPWSASRNHCKYIRQADS